MKITIGSDHAGVDYKQKISKHLRNQNHNVKDVGAFGKESVDYPDFAHLVSKDVSEQKSLGILICGSGNRLAWQQTNIKNKSRSLLERNIKTCKTTQRANIISLQRDSFQ